MKFSKQPPYSVTCVANTDILKGQEILSSYTKVTTSTSYRLRKIKQCWHFDCTCNRCKDPTENESYIGAIVCEKCTQNPTSFDFLSLESNRGYLLPKDPTNLQTDWICSRCQAEEDYSLSYELIENFSSALDNLVANHRYDVDMYLDLLNDAIKVLHPHHEIICDIAKWLVPIYCRGKLLHEFPLEDLILKRQLCLYQLEVLDKVNPGLTKTKGKLAQLNLIS